MDLFAPNYGAVLEAEGKDIVWKEVEKPTITGDTQIMIRMHYAVVPSGKWLAQYVTSRVGDSSLHLPQVVGLEGSGSVIAVGRRANKFARGAQVAVFSPIHPIEKATSLADGTFQKFLVTEQENAFRVPESMDLCSAATVPGVFVLASLAFFYTWDRRMPSHQSINSDEASDSAKNDDNSQQAVLVLAREMGLCLAIIQVGKNLGFPIYVAAPRGSHNLLRSCAVDKIFDYESATLAKDVLNYARESKSIAAVFDCISDRMSEATGIRIIKQSNPAKTVNDQKWPYRYTTIYSICKNGLGGALYGEMGHMEMLRIVNKYGFITREYLEENFKIGKFLQKQEVKQEDVWPQTIGTIIRSRIELERADQKCVVRLP